MNKKRLTLITIWAILILMLLPMTFSGCQSKPESRFDIVYSDAIYIVEDGKVINHKTKQPISLKEVDGWMVISPGLIRKLFRESVDNE